MAGELVGLPQAANDWFPDPYWLIYAVSFLVILTIIIGG